MSSLPPHNPTAEAAVIGLSMFYAEQAVPVCLKRGLTPADFYRLECRTAFGPIVKLHDEKKHVDAVTVGEQIAAEGKAADCGAADLMEMMEAARSDSMAALESHIDIIRKHSDARQMNYHRQEAARQLADPDVDLNAAAESVWQLTKGLGTTALTRFPSLSPAELDAGDFNLEYLIDGILTKGQPCILAGGKKCLKTNISIDLALSLASGFRFLGKHYVNRKAAVGFLSGESGKATIQETARRIAQSKGQSLKNFEGVRFAFNLPSLGSRDDLHHLRVFVEQHELEVIIIDPLYLAMDGIGDGASNLFTVGKQLAPLGDLMAELDCTLIICHHTRKGGKADPFVAPELEDIAWAGFQEFARQWILIGRREKFDPESDGEHRLWLNCGGSAGHSSLWAVDITEGKRTDRLGRRWDVDVLKASEARAEAAEADRRAQDEKEAEQQERDRQKILDALKRFPDGETENVIRDAAGLPGRKSKPVLLALNAEGLTEPVTITRHNNRRYDGWRLIRTDSDSTRTENTSDSQSTRTDSPPFRGESESDCARDVESIDGKRNLSESESGFGLPALPESLFGGNGHA